MDPLHRARRAGQAPRPPIPAAVHAWLLQGLQVSPVRRTNGIPCKTCKNGDLWGDGERLPQDGAQARPAAHGARGSCCCPTHPQPLGLRHVVGFASLVHEGKRVSWAAARTSHGNFSAEYRAVLRACPLAALQQLELLLLFAAAVASSLSDQTSHETLKAVLSWPQHMRLLLCCGAMVSARRSMQVCVCVVLLFRGCTADIAIAIATCWMPQLWSWSTCQQWRGP